MKTTGYIVVKAVRAYYGTDIRNVKAMRLTQSKPSKLAKDEIVVKITLDIPAEAFNPFEPEAVVTVPADLTERGPIEVTVGDANEEEDE